MITQNDHALPTACAYCPAPVLYRCLLCGQPVCRGHAITCRGCGCHCCPVHATLDPAVAALAADEHLGCCTDCRRAA